MAFELYWHGINVSNTLLIDLPLNDPKAYVQRTMTKGESKAPIYQGYRGKDKTEIDEPLSREDDTCFSENINCTKGSKSPSVLFKVTTFLFLFKYKVLRSL